MSKYFKTSGVLLISFLIVYAKLFAFETVGPTDPLFLAFKEDYWVNEKMNRMTLEEKIAQLMMIAVYPGQEESVITVSYTHLRAHET